MYTWDQIDNAIRQSLNEQEQQTSPFLVSKRIHPKII